MVASQMRAKAPWTRIFATPSPSWSTAKFVHAFGNQRMAQRTSMPIGTRTHNEACTLRPFDFLCNFLATRFLCRPRRFRRWRLLAFDHHQLTGAVVFHIEGDEITGQRQFLVYAAAVTRQEIVFPA